MAETAIERLLIAEDDPPMRLVALALGEPPDARTGTALRRFFGPGWPAALQRLQAIAAELGLAGQVAPHLAAAGPLEGQLALADYLFTERTPVSAAALREAPRLRLIQSFGVDCRHIDREAAAARQIAVQPLRRQVNSSVAEHTLLLMLAVARRLTRAHAAALAPSDAAERGPAAYNWADLEGSRPLCGQTLGIVGLGEIGREVALRAVPMQMRVLYAQRHRLPAEEEQALGVAYAPLPELLATSDIVSLHVPLNDATRHLIGATELARCKPGAVLVNTSRGSLVDEAALVAALHSGALGGAGLDVRHDEPPADAAGLAGLDTVVLTPHVAAGTGAELLADTRAVLEHIADARAGAAARKGGADPV